MKIEVIIQEKWYIVYQVQYKLNLTKRVEIFLDFHGNCIRYIAETLKGCIKRKYNIKGIIIIKRV